MSAAGSATRVANTVARRHTAATRPAMCPRRRVRSDLRGERSGPDFRAGSSLRPGAGRPIPPAVYRRRRRRLVGVAVATAVTMLALAFQASATDSGSGPVLGVVFSPVVLLPIATACLVRLVRYHASGGRGWRPASPSPTAGAATAEMPMGRAA